jgi:type III secretion protein Q
VSSSTAQLLRNDEILALPPEVWELNYIYRLREPLKIETDFGDVELTLKAPGYRMRWEGLWAQIGFSVEGRAGTLSLPADLVSELLRSRFPELDVQNLTADQIMLLADIAFRGLLDWATKIGSAQTELTGLVMTEHLVDQNQLSFDVMLPQGMICPAALSCHEVEKNRVMKAFASAKVQRQPFSKLTTTVSFRCGYTRLGVSELAGLEVGAGIVLDDTTLTFQKIVAVVGERFAQACTWQSVTPILDGPILTRAEASTAFYTTGGALSDEYDSDIGTAPVGDVPIHLVFELGRTEVPLAELESLSQGYVFETGKPLSQIVDVLANGKRIASGDLVRVGEGIGVRITRVIR